VFHHAVPGGGRHYDIRQIVSGKRKKQAFAGVPYGGGKLLKRPFAAYRGLHASDDIPSPSGLRVRKAFGGEHAVCCKVNERADNCRGADIESGSKTRLLFFKGLPQGFKEVSWPENRRQAPTGLPLSFIFFSGLNQGF
jgi:hypothetical protein